MSECGCVGVACCDQPSGGGGKSREGLQIVARQPPNCRNLIKYLIILAVLAAEGFQRGLSLQRTLRSSSSKAATDTVCVSIILSSLTHVYIYICQTSVSYTYIISMVVYMLNYSRSSDLIQDLISNYACVHALVLAVADVPYGTKQERVH